jgi:hypothetical protein
VIVAEVLSTVQLIHDVGGAHASSWIAAPIPLTEHRCECSWYCFHRRDDTRSAIFVACVIGIGSIGTACHRLGSVIRHRQRHRCWSFIEFPSQKRMGRPSLSTEPLGLNLCACELISKAGLCCVPWLWVIQRQRCQIPGISAALYVKGVQCLILAAAGIRRSEARE